MSKSTERHKQRKVRIKNLHAWRHRKMEQFLAVGEAIGHSLANPTWHQPAYVHPAEESRLADLAAQVMKGTTDEQFARRRRRMKGEV